MSYSKNVKMAEKVAREAHEGAVDKAGAPYIEHPRRVAERLETPEERVVGWLHDVVEDTTVSLGNIATWFGNDTADAMDAVTHRKGESWSDYLTRVKANPIAKAVKISDLIDNVSLSRMPEVKPKDVMRADKYVRALYFPMEIDGE